MKQAPQLNLSKLTTIVMVLLLVSINLVWYLSQKTNILGVSSDLTINQIVNQTNQVRLQNGLLPLEPNPKLEQAARQKAQSMIQEDQFQHSYLGQDNQLIEPWQFITQTEYQYLYAGENLAKDFYNTDTLIEAWLASPGHRSNLLSDRYTQIGVAVVEGEYQGNPNSVLIVQFLATPVPAGLTTIEHSKPSNFITTTLLDQGSRLFINLGSYPSELFLTSTFILALILIRLELQIQKHNQTRNPTAKHWLSK